MPFPPLQFHAVIDIWYLGLRGRRQPNQPAATQTPTCSSSLVDDVNGGVKGLSHLTDNHNDRLCICIPTCTCIFHV